MRYGGSRREAARAVGQIGDEGIDGSTIEAKTVLIDGKRLAELMIDYDVGVTPVTTYQLKRVDSDYFNNG
jgi:restriction endonuclease Mrr